MRLRRFLLFTMLFVWIIGGVYASAMNTVFSTEQLIEKEKSTFLENVNISFVEAAPPRRTIECFDVNQDGLIVLGESSSDKKMVCVYSEKGVFQYGYSFSCSGNFGVEWDENNINIYFSRSNIIMSVDHTGEVVDILKVQNTIDNNSYLNNKIYSTTRIVDGAKYELKNDIGFLNIFTSSYSQVVRTTSDNDSIVLYDATSTQLTHTSIIFVFVVIMIGVSIGVLIWLLIKLKRFISF